MTNLLRPFVFLIAVATLLSITSCLKNEDDERTDKIEEIEISEFLLKLINSGKDIDTTTSGMYYSILKNGTGAMPQAGDTCYIEYLGYFVNGNIFDASQSHYVDGIWELIYTESGSIEGFEEAIGLLKKDMEAVFIIPSKLAFGPVWYDFIPPYTPLVFELKMHDLKQKTE